MYGLIYCAKNKVNGKCYVGQTVKTLEQRVQGHALSIYRKKHEHLKMVKAIKKYGINGFDWSILQECSSLKELDEAEISWIDKLDSVYNGYNLTLGGHGAGKQTKEAIDKLSKRMMGNKVWLGKKHKEETRNKMSIKLIGNTRAVGRIYSLSDRIKYFLASKRKISNTQIIDILKMRLQKLSYKKIAVKYGINTTCICDIFNVRTLYFYLPVVQKFLKENNQYLNLFKKERFECMI